MVRLLTRAAQQRLQSHDRQGVVAAIRRPFADEVAVLTGGFDRPYVFGLTMALIAQGIRLEVIGSDEVDGPEMHATPGLKFLNLHGGLRKRSSAARRLWNTAATYIRLLRYSAAAKPKIFHILWNNKFRLLDRVGLMLYYRALGKKVVFTAHNVNAGKRDGNDSLVNRLSLRMQYRLANHIFVHTEKMKAELAGEFGVRDRAVTVIPFGINNAVPDTHLTEGEARQRLGIGDGERTILFFGNIGPYKGLDLLVAAFQRIAARNARDGVSGGGLVGGRAGVGGAGYRLIIAGKARGGCEPYLKQILAAIDSDESRERVILKIEYIPDADTEIYFKAADLLALPYTEISQSGVLFLGYSFGLPVVASDIGSFRDDIVEGENGYLCRPSDAADLADKIERYFSSDLYRNLRARRPEIRDYAEARHSWDTVGEMTRGVYSNLLER
jgi:D-inositol-3-phosphate glycosyltransferase